MYKTATVLPIFLFKKLPEDGFITFNDLPLVNKSGKAILPQYNGTSASDDVLWYGRNFRLGQMWVWAYLLYLFQGGFTQEDRLSRGLCPLLEVMMDWMDVYPASVLGAHPFIHGFFEEIDCYLNGALTGDSARPKMLGWIQYMRPERWNQCVQELHAANTEIEQATAMTIFKNETCKESKNV